mgnify:CR=1 FL=1
MVFEFPQDAHKRKYVCFVCGIAFESLDLYKSHITENHEMGRDYVVCPLDRCGFPVRCVRTHFKVHHPRETLPKTVQLRSTVWRDFSSKGDKKTSRPKFREGYMVSLKNGKEMHYRSGYECEVYEALEHIEEVLQYYVEPIKIGYIFEGEHHIYNPDLIVHFIDGKKEVWEIKPSNQTDLPKNHAKWAACESYCQNRGWKFVVMTERGIGKLKTIAREKRKYDL